VVTDLDKPETYPGHGVSPKSARQTTHENNRRALLIPWRWALCRDIVRCDRSISNPVRRIETFIGAN
jgi:hypothetical protein